MRTAHDEFQKSTTTRCTDTHTSLHFGKLFLEWRYVVRCFAVFFFCISLSACGSFHIPLNPMNLLNLFDGTSQSGGVRGSKSYTIKGISYYPLISAEGFREEGIASWYGKPFHGRTTANGEKYNMYAMTAAHKTLPFNTTLRVTNIYTGRSIHVRINDRGPFIRGRVIDLSYTAASQLGIVKAGTARVRIQVID